jgi:hypothetical protein
MSQSLKRTCEECPKRTNGCPGMCAALMKQLRAPGFRRDGEPETDYANRSITTYDGKGEDSKANPLNVYFADQEGKVDRTDAPEPGLEVDEKFRKVLREAVSAATFGHDKLRSRFYAFLRCASMAKIAKIAGVTKQNVWKQFAALIEEVGRQSEMDWKHSSPLKFKKRATNHT